MNSFGIAAPVRILFGRGESAKATTLIQGFGPRGIVVHGVSAGRAAFLLDGLRADGAGVMTIICVGEPDLPALERSLHEARAFRPDWIAAVGGGAVLDLGKALAGLIPQTTAPLDHLEGVGRGLRLDAPPLPFIAIPTTAGTGAEATKNAVIGVPDQGRKVSLRDDRMLARLAIVDPALTDHCPRNFTLASGLDAITQVIEPYVSTRANSFTDAICKPAIGGGLTALMRLMRGEDAAARDQMAWVSLSGGLALANGGLGAVHGLAGVIGGQFGAAHGAICGALLGPVLGMNIRLAARNSETAARLEFVCGALADVLGCAPDDAPKALQDWSRWAGLADLGAMGVSEHDHAQIARMSLDASSMKGNPFVPGIDDLTDVLRTA